MPRTYKRKPSADSRRRKYSEDSLNKAVSAVIDGILSSYSASVQYDVPRGTVARHVAYYKRIGHDPAPNVSARFGAVLSSGTEQRRIELSSEQCSHLFTTATTIGHELTAQLPKV